MKIEGTKGFTYIDLEALEIDEWTKKILDSNKFELKTTQDYKAYKCFVVASHQYALKYIQKLEAIVKELEETTENQEEIEVYQKYIATYQEDLVVYDEQLSLLSFVDGWDNIDHSKYIPYVEVFVEKWKKEEN